MGGPSYQTPYPFTTPKGKTVIWDWGAKQWGPYDPAKDPKKLQADKDAAAGPAGVPDARGDQGTAGRSDGIGAPGGRGTSEGVAVTQRRRVAPRYARVQGAMPGESLLTPRGDR
jgi:hypothetical protein